MKVYIVLYDRFIDYNNYYETEIVEVFKYQSDAEEYIQNNKNYRIEEWYVNENGRRNK